MEVVDSQVHIWQPDTPERPWHVPPGVTLHSTKPFLYEDLREQMDESGVDRAILVPPTLDGDRNDFALEAAAKYPDRFAVMGRIALEDPSSKAKLSKFLDQPGMLGVRLTFHRPVDMPWLTDGTADRFWPEAERLNIPVMIHAPESLDAIGKIAHRHPGLRLIYDHMGFDRDTVDDKAAPAAERMAQLAIHPNIFVKVSALPCFSTQPYPFKNLDAPLRRVIEAFGPRRSFWGSDLTRFRDHCSYRHAVEHFTKHLDFLSPEDLEWIMGRGLRQCLGWR